MSNWDVFEPNNAFQYLSENNNDVNVGDTITEVTNNQQGQKVFKVTVDENGTKKLTLIQDYDTDTYVGSLGGRRRLRKSRRHKRSRRNRRTRRRRRQH